MFALELRIYIIFLFNNYLLSLLSIRFRVREHPSYDRSPYGHKSVGKPGPVTSNVARENEDSKISIISLSCFIRAGKHGHNLAVKRYGRK